MAEKSTTKSRKCKQCECEIQFGMYCEDCVSSERVCQMCGVDISHRDESSTSCSPKCRQKLHRRRKNTQVTQRNVTPENGLSDASRDELLTMIELLKKQIDIQQKMLDYFLSSGVGVVPVDSNKIPMPNAPLITDELPVVEVKKSKASSNSSSNFLNSIMALNG